MTVPGIAEPQPSTTLKRAMGITPPRLAVAEVFGAMRNGATLDIAFDRHIHGLEDRERRWAHELAYGVLRRRAWLDSLLADLVRGGLARLDADLRDLLRAGAYQLLEMYSVPAYAAIAQTVELAKHRHGVGASRLVNAVLRNLDRQRHESPKPLPRDPIEALVLTHSHPRWLVERWITRFGKDEAVALLAANNAEPLTYLRPYNVVREQLESALEADGIRVADAPLVRNSVTLPPGASIGDLRAFRAGQFFVQDPAATLVTEYAAFVPGSVVADLCAAPGGKALELARSAERVVATDRSPSRLSRLADSLRRLEARGIDLVVMDATRPSLREMDGVLLDAPCSGTGTFRRHPDTRWRIRPKEITRLAAQQVALLDAAARIVRPGGLLVYSTCSLETEENDQPVEQFLATHREFTLEPPPAGVVPAEVLSDGLLRVFPHRHGTDGAFAARLRRRPV